MSFMTVNDALDCDQIWKAYSSSVEWENDLEAKGYVHTVLMRDKETIGDVKLSCSMFHEITEALQTAFQHREMSDWTCYFLDVTFVLRFTKPHDAVYAKLILS